MANWATFLALMAVALPALAELDDEDNTLYVDLDGDRELRGGR